jgi:hypothetical protein
MDADGKAVDGRLYKLGGRATSRPSQGKLTLISPKSEAREKIADEGEEKKSSTRRTVKSPTFARSTASFDNKRTKEQIINSPPQKSGGTSKVRSGVEKKAEVGSDSEDDSPESSGTSPEKAEVDTSPEKTKVKQPLRRSDRLRKKSPTKTKTPVKHRR